jgi:glycosyltransferase involved in cell wall biosynthesis
MTPAILIWCPDRHILYDGRSPDDLGVGGGITARIRVARALVRHGHRVQVWGHCRRRESLDGVEYVPLDQRPQPGAEVTVVTTSGGSFDLSQAGALDGRSRLTVVWLHGPQTPSGLEALVADSVYTVSNFVCEEIRKTWPSAPLFVAYNGFEAALFDDADDRHLPRDPHALVYASHPSKGLSTALEMLRRLRHRDRRFHLTVFGGESLWGEADLPREAVDGVEWRGRIGQRQLALELTKASYSLCLQSRQEPFGYVVTESMRAGCIPIASPVGAYPELIENEVNGFLVHADEPAGEAEQGANLILELAEKPHLMAALRANARKVPWTSDLMALTWLQHWAFLLEGQAPSDPQPDPCQVCRGECVSLADGNHCLVCGHFRPAAAGPRPEAALETPGRAGVE